MLNAEVPYVLYLIGWIAKKFDYINRVTKPSIRGYIDTLYPSLLCIS